MENKRKHIRTPISVKVKIWHDSIGSAVLTTRDVSDGGVFLITEGAPIVPPIGTVLKGQVQGPVEDLPIVQMKVVRMEPEGVGLKFLLDEEGRTESPE